MSQNNSTNMEGQVVVCCCCRPWGSAALSRRSSMRRQPSIYHDATQGSEPHDATQGSEPEPVEENELFFFDTRQDTFEEEDYPIFTYNYVPTPPHRVSIVDPETMLRPPARVEELPVATARRSLRQRVFHRGSIQSRKDLQQPRVSVQERGYPGELDTDELAECLKFYREIHKRQGTILDIVYSYKDYEEEAYSLCRFMRGCKFDADSMLERLENGKAMFEDAADQDFYPNLEEHLGVPMPLFLQVYPQIYHGNAKNGCPVCYFKAGRIDAEGLMCLTTIKKAEGFYWNQYVHVFPKHIAHAQQNDPNFVRCESINVVDLTGISRSQFTSETMDVIKLIGKISDFYPETLNCMVIVNAPGWFAFTWKIIKGFLDPRTARKVEVYSSISRGQKRLLELADEDQVPSDFGGTAPSTDVLFQQHGQEEVVYQKQYVARPICLKKNDTKNAKEFVELKTGEVASIQVRTRSNSAASVSVSFNGELVEQDLHVVHKIDVSDFPEEDPPMPSCVELCQLKGPGKVSVKLEDLGDTRSNKQLSYGHFLVVAVVEESM